MENHVIDLLPGFALGILDEKETEDVLEHLSDCVVCQAELSSYQVVTQSLGLAAPMVEPPPGMKQRVLDSIAVKLPVALNKQSGRAVSRKRSLLSTFLFSWRPLVALLVLALIASNLFLWSQISQLRASSAVPNFGLVKMVGTGVYAGASGVLVVSPDGQDGTLVVAGFNKLDTAHQYQLWLMKDNRRTSGGVFSVSKAGYGSLWVKSDDPLNSYQQFGVTIEPYGGSPSQTGAKVIGGKY